ncbi:MAG: PIG-L family deacetylase [Polyangiales bacterium]
MRSARTPRSLRFERYDDIVVSPHLDDAVYSCAGTILAARELGRRVLVITVFGHGRGDSPPEEGLFGDYVTREAEDREAMAIVDADYVWLDLPELAFRPRTFRERLAQLSPRRAERDDPAFVVARDRVRELVTALAADGARISFPLGIGFHPDHRLCFAIGRELALESRYDVSFYEDVPYAVVPALRRLRFEAIGANGPGVEALAGPREGSVPRLGGSKGTLVVPVALGLFTLISLLHAKLRPKDAAPLALVGEEHVIDGQRLRKVRAIEAYRSQTPLFFPEDVESVLPRSRGALVERVFRLAPSHRSVRAATSAIEVHA